jgi:hypothetical protein
MHLKRAREQIEAVACRFPTLKAVFEGPWLIIWRGHLIGFEQAYEVRIVWPRFSPWEKFELETHRPRVYVLDPPLMPRIPGGRIEHLYWREPVAGNIPPPDLCLYDPRSDTWDEGLLLADTIIPWICDWLCAYELWHATGIWHAPNSHPDRVKRDGSTLTETADRAPATALSLSLTRFAAERTGTSSSTVILAAAARGDFHWFSRDAWIRLPTAAEGPEVDHIRLAA